MTAPINLRGYTRDQIHAALCGWTGVNPADVTDKWSDLLVRDMAAVLAAVAAGGIDGGIRAWFGADQTDPSDFCEINRAAMRRAVIAAHDTTTPKE